MGKVAEVHIGAGNSYRSSTAPAGVGLQICRKVHAVTTCCQLLEKSLDLSRDDDVVARRLKVNLAEDTR